MANILLKQLASITTTKFIDFYDVVSLKITLKVAFTFLQIFTIRPKLLRVVVIPQVDNNTPWFVS